MDNETNKNELENEKVYIFISHSHKDINKVIAFAGWLKTNFGLEAFIDSCSWGYCDELLKIIDLLINLHFDPCKDIPQKPHDFPNGVFPLYDCTLFAIEMGWLECVKRLCTYLIAEYNDHWEKMKKSYFAEAKRQWQMRNPQCIRYPSETEQKLILKYLAPLVK